MLLNSKTIALVNSLQLINESIIFSSKLTGIKDSAGSIIAFIDLEKLENKPFPKDFGILKIKEFMDLLKIIGEDANITMDDKNIIHISKDGMSCKYLTTNVEALSNACGVKPTILENVNNAELVASFELDMTVSDKIKKAATLLGFDDMVLNIDDIITVSTSEQGINGNEFSLNVTPNIINSKANIFISIKNLKRIPTTDYIVSVHKHTSRQDTYLLKLIPKNNDALIILIPSKVVK
ncbi:putative sliding clamp DNA polymerase accessory protein [Campylobacter phage F370]|uniref:Putative sliding clamp DNA polymerase accessory protein n=1 Tax=Campylobacter phage F372 TaxID=2794375 RepID=A0A7T3KHN6_9CAUD|nr:putative sliding clamp DNA polymerase accessory protein [Campylobacter phage F370]QPX65247.1 putative sliding clamp DNA polymerase accessory protein [Campylobacter phage F371]QPX65406.1 putative sliding clamp DNA polymerase accessory protein [Campylobacter phage F372]